MDKNLIYFILQMLTEKDYTLKIPNYNTKIKYNVDEGLYEANRVKLLYGDEVEEMLKQHKDDNIKINQKKKKIIIK